MIKKVNRNKMRQKRHLRARTNIAGTAQSPRLNVFRSNKNISAQLIDDEAGVTLASASSFEENISGTKVEQAKQVGKLIAERAETIGVKTAVFDRGGYLYHGRVKALAEGAREQGLEI